MIHADEMKIIRETIEAPLLAENKRLKDALEKASVLAQDLKADLVGLRADCEGLIAGSAALRSENAGLKAQAEGGVRALGKVMGELTEARDEIAALRAEFDAVVKDRSAIARAFLAPYARDVKPDETGGYSTTIIEFPGCYSEGETYEEALANLTDAAIGWILAAQDQGQSIPEPIGRKAKQAGRE